MAGTESADSNGARCATLSWARMTANIEHIRVHANGIDFHVAAAGNPDGPSILCLHGFPEGWMSWRPVMERLQEARIYAPDLRGYGETTHSRVGYDVFTLTDDVRALIHTLRLDRPLLVSHDWGGALGWIFAHRYSYLIQGLVVVNCTHPRTLVRAALRGQDWQPFRIPWVLPFQLPWVPEAFLTTELGHRLLRWSFTVREGRKGSMDVALLDEILARFRGPDDLRGPIQYYREFARTLILSALRERLERVYATRVSVPVTVVWGEKDGALSEKVALQSGGDAGCRLDWRPLPGVGHFVDLEAPDELTVEIRRVLGQFVPMQGAGLHDA
jgi:pimeloyl-ACP methyl ester carboxylesterase